MDSIKTPFEKLPSEILDSAGAYGFPVGNLQNLLNRDTIKIGDELTFLVEMYDDSGVKIWLVSNIWQGNVTGSKNNITRRYASTGDVFEFSSQEAKIEISILGPFNSETPKLLKAPANVGKDYLKLGFFELAQLEYNLQQKKLKDPDLPEFWFYTNRSNPVEKNIVDQQKLLMKKLSINKDRLRAISGFGLAFDAFVNLINDTPGISEILWDIAEKPSWFSILTKGISTSNTTIGNITAVNPEIWQLPDNVNGYYHPLSFKINDEESLLLGLYVTKPYGILQLSAGIFGLIAKPVDTSINKKLIVRLIGAKFN